jgi:hypothetical protein
LSLDLARGAPEARLLAENDRELLFQRLVAEQAVHGLAAGNNVLFDAGSSVCHSEQVLDACLGLGQGLLAEEAVASLLEQ